MMATTGALSPRASGKIRLSKLEDEEEEDSGEKKPFDERQKAE